MSRGGAGVVLRTVLAAAAGAVVLAGCGDGPPAGAAPTSAPTRLQALERAAAARPAADGLAALGDAYLQEHRDTAAPGWLPRAEAAYEDALRRDGRSVRALAGAGALALVRHDFRRALTLGRRAQRLAPGAALPLGVIADAQVELGRLDDAERTVQRMVDRSPSLAAYARVSYLRELRGDVDGAVEAMRLAVAAASGAPGDAAALHVVVGDLELERGRRAAARRAYGSAEALVPGLPTALEGIARLEGAEGRFGPAIRRLQVLVRELPFPDHALVLGDMQLAAGQEAAARRSFALARTLERRLTAVGVDVRSEAALREADHGDPRRAVRLARAAWAAAPNLHAAEAVGWALTAAGRPREGLTWIRRALRTGSRDPGLHLHAGLSALAAGERGAARGYLRQALSGAGLSVLGEREARAALRRAGGRGAVGLSARSEVGGPGPSARDGVPETCRRDRQREDTSRPADSTAAC